jgi:hypothetical protein
MGRLNYYIKVEQPSTRLFCSILFSSLQQLINYSMNTPSVKESTIQRPCGASTEENKTTTDT